MKYVQAGDETITSNQDEYDALRYVSGETPCPYLPGLRSRNEAYNADALDGKLYERLLGRGFRRSGRIVYRPRCRKCSECRSIRIPVDRLVRTRSLRRVWRRNADVAVEVGEPQPTEEKFELFRRYLSTQHDEAMSRTYEAFCEFLYDSPMETHEFCYRLGRRLIAVGLADYWPGGLSSVYLYYDPDFSRRSLGTFSVIWEADFCMRNGVPYYYLGYFVPGSPKMAYKSRYRPFEILVADNAWVAVGV